MTMRYCTLVTLLYLWRVFAQQCEVGQQAIFGMMLQRHTFTTMKASIAVKCNQACHNDFRCHSFNYVISKELCELNNRTKEARPENFVPNSERYYVKSIKKRVIPGTIPEFPAETCKEIKASEDGKATSGEYWFDSVIKGETVLIPCDMETEDADECKATIRVCDENADCQNTPGSYRCSCKTGFSGDGQTCKDIDECASGVHGCHVSASCTNTVGSFSCSCNLPYVGNGRSCSNLPSECQNYQSLTEGDRRITSGNEITICDKGLNGWYRFEGAAGTKMPTSS
ncbi:fibrillin-1-like [Stylophora pistillata]|uniref:fibrillin-1-like n=1 Tax=Stylophora pistillata TaxID=50429 RepID=UPI000C03AA12|nr:fibrillin-1-like [Stylophora pistillata]